MLMVYLSKTCDNHIRWSNYVDEKCPSIVQFIRYCWTGTLSKTGEESGGNMNAAAEDIMTPWLLEGMEFVCR